MSDDHLMGLDVKEGGDGGPVYPWERALHIHGKTNKTNEGSITGRGKYDMRRTFLPAIQLVGLPKV